MQKEKLGGFLSKPGVRDYWKRLALLAAPAFLLFYTGVFIGPLDIINSNQAYLTFSAGNLFWPLLGLTLAATLVLAGLLALVRGRVHVWLFGALLALALMFYLQGAVLGDLIALDGSSFRWQDDPASAYRNLALWGGAVLLLAVLCGLFPELGKTVGLIACGAIFVAQTVALVMVWQPMDRSEANYQLSGDEEFDLSADENVIVITLDQMSPLIFEEVLELDPELEETFKDFLYYDNMSSAYSFTFPSMCYLLTHEHFDATVPTRQYVENAWNSELCENFYDTLHDSGYEVKLYVESNYAAIDTANMLGKADNVVEAGPLVVRWPLLQSALWMSFYRYMPVMLKNPFCISTGQIVDVAEYRGVGKVRINYDFYPALTDEGLTADEENKVFTWYHLQGAHFPFFVQYDGSFVTKELEENSENRLNQLHGYLLAVGEYFKQLKELGLYDDATILISADHGYFECFQAAFLIKTPGRTADAMEIRHAQVAQEDIMPTILGCLGEDYSDYGSSVFDISETEDRVRTTSIWGYMSNYPDVDWIGNLDQWDAEANGFERYNVFGVFHYVGDRDTILAEERFWYNYGVADEILPLYDSFY